VNPNEKIILQATGTFANPFSAAIGVITTYTIDAFPSINNETTCEANSQIQFAGIIESVPVAPGVHTVTVSANTTASTVTMTAGQFLIQRVAV
jgi:hypothetical protein